MNNDSEFFTEKELASNIHKALKVAMNGNLNMNLCLRSLKAYHGNYDTIHIINTLHELWILMDSPDNIDRYIRDLVLDYLDL